MKNLTQNDETLRNIRKEFFAFRNGIIADKLRNAGDPHPIIMGCLLVDIMSISRSIAENVADDRRLATVAQELWDDTNSRECRLAAPMLYPAEMMTLEMAMQWCQSVETTEIADNLCHKLLRDITDADALWRALIADERLLVKYTGYRLLLNLLLLDRLQPNEQLRIIINNDAKQAHGPLVALLKDILEEFTDHHSSSRG